MSFFPSTTIQQSINAVRQCWLKNSGYTLCGLHPTTGYRLLYTQSVQADHWRLEKTQFHFKTAPRLQPWGCHWEAPVWLQPLFKAHSVILWLIVHCRLVGVTWGEKCPVSVLQDWLWSQKKSSPFCMLIYTPFCLRKSGGGGEKKKNSFLQEVCNKSLAINDNGICACVCHLCESNSGGVPTDLFVY